MSYLIPWLIRQLDRKEFWAHEASVLRYPQSGYIDDGAAWQWVTGDDWDPVKPDPMHEDFPGTILTTALEFNTGPVRTSYGIKHEMPQGVLHADEPSAAVAGHIIANDPAAVMQSIKAQRKIVQACTEELSDRGDGALAGRVDCLAWDVLVQMANQFRDQPGWKEEW